MSETVTWEGDTSVCGRFVIFSEQVRYERRFYWLGFYADDVAAKYDEMGLDGSTDKRTVKRQAQRISDALAGASAPGHSRLRPQSGRYPKGKL